MNNQTSEDTQRAEINWPVTVKLKHPIQFGSETIESLVFRRGKMSDLKGMSIERVPPVDQLLMIASRMCGQPLKVVESIDFDDVGPVIEVIVFFFASCLRTGKPA